MKSHSQLICRLAYSAFLMGMLAGGLSLGQEIESTEVDGDSLRVRIRAPRIELERINPDGSSTAEASSSSNSQIVELEIPMDSPTKLFRARVRLGDQDFGSALRPIVEQSAIPNLDDIRPSSINLEGNELTLQFPPEHTEVRNRDFFPEGFPLFLDEGPLRMQPGRAPGSYTAVLNEGVARKFRFELEGALNRLRELGDGTVPVYADRQFTGRMAVPAINALGDSLDLFPFRNSREIQPLAFGGGAILGSSSAVDSGKSLLITDLSVVNDPERTWDPFNPNALSYIDPATGRPRKWTFGFLMEEMCNSVLTGVDPKIFARRWIDHFEQFQTINFDDVPDRQGDIQSALIDKWESANLAEGLDPLDLKNAPFRLTAIVNRVDLRSASGYAAGDAGECRFVFCAYDLDTGAHKPMTVIFEYGVPLSTCIQIKNWAQQWQQLTDLDFVSVDPASTFNTDLESLTDVVALANADASKPNGSAINQLRSNNFIEPFTLPWTMREWQITGAGIAPSHLTAVTTKQTPANSKMGTSDLANYLNTFEADILAGTHSVPLSFPGATPFLSGKSEVPTPGFFWNTAGIANNEARHHFSLNTCNGCHGGEAGAQLPTVGGLPLDPVTGMGATGPSSSAPSFVHIAERNATAQSHLSRFLTGTGSALSDPVSSVPRVFDDLTRRAADLDFAANMPCLMLSLTPALATRSH
ncbi:MAG: hypothetical protein CMP30_09725 [Roseibacillus sp.]|nr:hypothetical protein [Roseibacillus sp.]